ncbi:adenosine deaminase [Leifsonia bigeumensis]|uniref:adenosine deaminase n=1 Tax=Leifsonella bigeumensis TaxID=433643 RepID=A0ABP7EXV6_9MICO
MLINLHSHLEGRVRPETAAELAAIEGLPTLSDGWQRAIRLGGPADLTVYLEKVASTYPFFRTPDAARRIAREAVEDAAASGHDYLELRFGPATHARDERRMRDVVLAVAEGMREASTASGVPSGLVLAALRHHTAEVNESVARVAALCAGAGVVGFDLAGDELLHPALEPHISAFDIARAAGLGITCHAAEAASAHAAREAVTLLGATRIGHGAHIIDDPEVLSWVADAGVVVEICPTSNWYTGAIASVADHPAPAFRDAGVRLVLGDDNPMQTGADLRYERAVLTADLGFDDEDLDLLDRTSVEAAFLEDGTRARLRGRLSP